MNILTKILTVAATILCSQAVIAQISSPFGFEGNSVGTWAGTATTETVAINTTASTVRTGSYSLKLTTTGTSSSSKQWYANDPFIASSNNVYIHFIYWAKAQDAGVSGDASFRYGTTTPPTGAGSSSNASNDVPVSTTVWTRVTNNVSSSSSRYYYPGPRKTVSVGATSIYIDDAILYTSNSSTTDTVVPGTPSALSAAVSGNLVNLSWTSSTDLGTGVQATMLLRTANLTAAVPATHDQAMYSTTGGANGPSVIGDWTVISTTLSPTATSYLDASATPGNYKYAVVLRDLAYNYSAAAISSTVNVGAPVPTIFVDQAGFTAGFGNTVMNTNSAEQHYNVTAYNMSGNVTVTAPAGFQVSLSSGTAFTPVTSLTIIPTGGTVSTTAVYVRFRPTTATGATGTLNITNAGTGATTQSVAVNGNALSIEPTNGSTISFGNVTDTKIQVHLPTTGNGNRRIVVIRSGQDVSYVPADGAPVAGVDSNYSIATNQGNGNKVVYDGNGQGNSVVTVSGLTKSTLYYFAVYEYNVGTGTSQNYMSVSPQTALANTASQNVGITGTTSTKEISIFPNPFSDKLTITIDNPGCSVMLRDIYGRSWKMPLTGSTIETATLPNGTYLLSVYDAKGILLHSRSVLKMN